MRPTMLLQLVTRSNRALSPSSSMLRQLHRPASMTFAAASQHHHPSSASSPFSTTSSTRSNSPDHFNSSSAQTRNKGAIGPFTLRAGAIFALTGVGLFYYFQKEKAAIQARKEQETATAKIGRPNIGGPFILTDQNGNPFSDKDLLGKWSLVYFGFTNCPDICPEELDKMGSVVQAISKSHNTDILPIFITCDPARDDVKSVKAYVRDFIPSLVGLTGSYDDIKKCCKAYRVYFSTPPNAKPTDDYLVDHSIFFYLMDPEGRFVDAFGRSMGPLEVENKIAKYLDLWKESDGKEGWSDMK